jgi:short-subunit dehydrogenase
MRAELLRGTVLLTGASGGLGHAIARALAARGAKLILTGRRAEVLDPLAAETGGRAVAVDLADGDAVRRLVDDAGEVDVLVANAGLPATGLIDTYSVEGIDRVLDVNLRAPIVLAKLLYPAMVERGRGHLVFMSSLAGKSAQSKSSLYSATKFGLRGFALGLRADLDGTGVGVSTIFPTFIRDAGMFADSGAKLPPGVGTRAPEDVAQAVIRAVERNRAEVDVAPPHIRLGAQMSGLMPSVSQRVARRLGADKVSSALTDAQREKR